MKSVLLLTLGLAVTGGCGQSVGGVVDGSVVTDAPRVDASREAGAVQCGAGGANVFPTFARECRSDAECVVVAHQTDCCGNTEALGIRQSERARFTESEDICRSMYPGCGCPSFGIRTEDGLLTQDLGSVEATCEMGTCRARFPGIPCGEEFCRVNTVCVRECCAGPGCVPTQRCRVIPAGCGLQPGCSCLSDLCESRQCQSQVGRLAQCQCP
ncbi:MAG: hypothetical protein Q8Q09_04680 [Deltaproteobacteria bacterium]|nr:hypothetical protein [Deltaproteobacteria bacterium]